MTHKKPILFSGIQPSGHLMIGNYIGAIKHWLNLQKDYDCLFALVDLHTITVKQDPKELRNRCYDFLALYIACGLDPDENILFVQSHVAEHAQLAWILNCHTYMGELNRMTQFKDKSTRYTSNINAGLFTYPVLMAADILLYQSNLVPVGHDQKQHLELSRDLAIRMNTLYGEIFTIPEPYIPPIGGRIMSLQDPQKKMSKSDINEKSYIGLLDPPDVIRLKLRRAVTDLGNEIVYGPDKPGISNLLALYSNIQPLTIEELEQKYRGQGYSVFKNDIAEALIEFLMPLQEKFHRLRNKEESMDKILQRGAQQARERASMTLEKVKDAIGFIPKRETYALNFV